MCCKRRSSDEIDADDLPTPAQLPTPPREMADLSETDRQAALGSIRRQLQNLFYNIKIIELEGKAMKDNSVEYKMFQGLTAELAEKTGLFYQWIGNDAEADAEMKVLLKDPLEEQATKDYGAAKKYSEVLESQAGGGQ